MAPPLMFLKNVTQEFDPDFPREITFEKTSHRNVYMEGIPVANTAKQSVVKQQNTKKVCDDNNNHSLTNKARTTTTA